MEQNRIKNTSVQFWISPETDDTVRRIATAEGRSVSSVYRDLVDLGLVAGGYRSGEKDLAALVRAAVEETIKPHVERLAAISAKGVQIDAASYFLQVYNGWQALPAYQQEEYNDLAAQARKLGIEYLKLSKDKNIDDFIRRGISRMEANDE
ncbi:MAG: hypothetical protein IJX67_08935 [Oscillospiraceae bacterium]|nr:hypothetical protein [Oscillospiraceae bacterium]